MDDVASYFMCAYEYQLYDVKVLMKFAYHDHDHSWSKAKSRLQLVAKAYNYVCVDIPRSNLVMCIASCNNISSYVFM